MLFNSYRSKRFQFNRSHSYGSKI